MGLRFEQKASGVIVFVGEIAVKASSVDRAFSMGKLCKRLDEFVPGKYLEENAKIEPEPASSINLEEWKQYQDETKRAASQIVVETPTMGLLKARQRSDREQLPSKLAEQCRHSGTIAPSDANSGQAVPCPRPILNIAQHFQKLQHKQERRQLRRKTRKPSRRRPRFETWLRAHDLNGKAEHWRYRQKLENIPSNLWEAPPLPEGQKYDPLLAYGAHRRAILQASPEMERSPSKLDSGIAMCMREKGFKREEVANAIQHCVPEAQAGQETRNWQRYAERVADYAFGLPGDLWLAQGAELRKQAQEKRAAEARQEAVPPEAPRI